MSKAIFLNFPTHGCINSLLATAKELVDRGEKIIYYCTEEFEEKIRQTGAEFRPYKGLINKFKIEHFDLFEALKLNLEMTVDKMEYNFDAIQNENPDYIIHDSLCTWGKQIASVLKIPAVNLMHSFPITQSSITFNSDTAVLLLKVGLYKIFGHLKNDYPPGMLKQRYDIDISLGDILINKEALNIVYTSKDMEPEIYKKSKSYKFVGPSLFFKDEQNDFPFDRIKDKKVVYISLGTLLSNNPVFFKKCIDAFLNKEYYVVLSTGFEVDMNTFKDLPENFIVKQSVPQQKLLELVDLFITHAGMNSVNEAVCFGVPMILMPHTIEQKMIARRIIEMGLGKIMNVGTFTPEKLYIRAHEIISDSIYKDKAFEYKPIFNDKEKKSHIEAADSILYFIKTQSQIS